MSVYTDFVRSMTGVLAGVVAVVLATTSLKAQAPPPPPTQTTTPKPTPTATPAVTPKPTPAATSATGAQNTGAADPRLAGVPMYPGAAFLQSMDLGNGQWLFVFGTNDLFASAVAFYRGQLGKSTEVSRTPAIQQFDLGSFDSGRMTQRPSVLVKDFTWPDPAGYLHVTGTTEVRYKTLIQIIPATR